MSDFLMWSAIISLAIGRGLDNINLFAILGFDSQAVSWPSVVILLISVVTIIRHKIIVKQLEAFSESSLNFSLPYILVILQLPFIFKVFGCHINDLVQGELKISWCVSYIFILILSTFVYSLACHQTAKPAIVISFIIFLVIELLVHSFLLTQLLSLKTIHQVHLFAFHAIVWLWKGASLYKITKRTSC